MADREPTTLNTGSNGGGGWAVAAILLAAIICLGLYLFGSDVLSGSDSTIDVSVSLPRAEAPVAPNS